ncbi:MAG: carbohydrate ABC transporter permease [Candidatus Xenobia bacterium]
MRRVGLYALLIVLFIFLTGPFLWLVSTSLKSGDVYHLSSLSDLVPKHPSLRAYHDVLHLGGEEESLLPRMLLNTVFICVVGVVAELVIASMAAYPLARMEFKGKDTVFAILLSSMMLPAQANMIVNFNTIRVMGLYDTLAAVIIPSAVSVFGIFLMRQAYLVIPRELEDAARIDGCNELGIWWNVLLPLSRPALATLAVFGFVAHWNDLIWPLVILKNERNYPISVGLTWLSGVFSTRFGLVAAGCVLATIPTVLLFLALQQHFIKGITAGAVK